MTRAPCCRPESPKRAFRRLINDYPHHDFTSAIKSYIVESADSVVPFLGNATKDISYPLDRLSNGNNLIQLYQETGNATYRDNV